MKPSFHSIVTHKYFTTKIWSQGCLFSPALFNSALQGQLGGMGKTLENISYEEKRRERVNEISSQTYPLNYKWI